MSGLLAALGGILTLGLTAYWYYWQHRTEGTAGASASSPAASSPTASQADPQAAAEAQRQAEEARRQAEEARRQAEEEARRQQERREKKLRTVLESDSRARDYLRRRAGLPRSR